MPLINKVASPLRDAATMESSRELGESCASVCFGEVRSFHGGLGEECQITDIKNNLVKCWGGVISYDANSAKQCGSEERRRKDAG